MRERFIENENRAFTFPSTVVHAVKADVELMHQNLQSISRVLSIPKWISPTVDGDGRILEISYKVRVRAQLQDLTTVYGEEDTLDITTTVDFQALSCMTADIPVVIGTLPSTDAEPPVPLLQAQILENAAQNEYKIMKRMQRMLRRSTGGISIDSSAEANGKRKESATSSRLLSPEKHRNGSSASIKTALSTEPQQTPVTPPSPEPRPSFSGSTVSENGGRLITLQPHRPSLESANAPIIRLSFGGPAFGKDMGSFRDLMFMSDDDETATTTSATSSTGPTVALTMSIGSASTSQSPQSPQPSIQPILPVQPQTQTQTQARQPLPQINFPPPPDTAPPPRVEKPNSETMIMDVSEAKVMSTRQRIAKPDAVSDNDSELDSDDEEDLLDVLSRRDRRLENIKRGGGW
ncbi:hypothetical protein BCR43DRAFT_78775 [Syncephalastrum racemosum]|uniref:Uncharacterized protein n=1 Tax=Syncephalastrum racemosum TaxID=13706 RepID=A0A1X2H2U8_SYNRA|nr:hypothetical protein BCR43DRAFT_78775 [Syncephalastrum racemosum]